MTRRQVADGEGLQIWRVAANALKNQLLTVDKGWFARLRVEQGLINLLSKN
jgi:hypothetical protein